MYTLTEMLLVTLQHPFPRLTLRKVTYLSKYFPTRCCKMQCIDITVPEAGNMQIDLLNINGKKFATCIPDFYQKVIIP